MPYNEIELERFQRPISLPPAVDVEYEQAPAPLSHYAWILRRYWWKILAFVAICTTATWFVCQQIQPVYESTARIDVDRRAPSGIIGQDSMQAVPSNDADQFLTTQIELIESDGVLRPVVEKFDLLRKEKQFDSDANQTKRLANAPVVLKKLKVSRPPNSFILHITYRSPDAQLAADVANAIAQSYLERTYEIRMKSTAGLSTFMERQIDELKAKMESSNRALAKYEQELNVVNPDDKTNILAARLLQLNTEYTTAQSDRVTKEAAYNSMKTGALAAVQISPQADSLAKLQERVQESQARLAELKATYGPKYSEYRRAANQLAQLKEQYDETKSEISKRIEVEFKQARNREEMLKKSVAETKSEFDKLNIRTLEYQQLKREADADKGLYDELVRKIKEAGINAGFQNSAIRIADYARPGAKPVFPQKKLMLLISFLASAVLGIGAAVVFDLLDTTINNPEQAARTLQVDVIGVLPSVGRNELFSISSAPADSGDRALALRRPGPNAYYRSVKSYQEAIRTLRASILLSNFNSHMRSILITSASPGEGKSTTAAHLAIAHAEQSRQKRTLLIDADLRRPAQHHLFQLDNSVGLSTALTEVLPWRDVVNKISWAPNLDVIPSGPSSKRASDVIGPMMADLLAEASRDYDLIIVDAPPLLGLAEPMQIASATDGVIIISRAGETNKNDIAKVLAVLTRLRAKVIGLVLNRVKMTDDYYKQI